MMKTIDISSMINVTGGYYARTTVNRTTVINRNYGGYGGGGFGGAFLGATAGAVIGAELMAPRPAAPVVVAPAPAPAPNVVIINPGAAQ